MTYSGPGGFLGFRAPQSQTLESSEGEDYAYAVSMLSFEFAAKLMGLAAKDGLGTPAGRIALTALQAIDILTIAARDTVIHGTPFPSLESGDEADNG